MSQNELPGTSANRERWDWLDWAAALSLFLGTSATVVWQNSRLAVLWDLSYVLENSYRISLGDFPYRDFPFPYAPVTFLIQSLLIRLTGRVFFHHVLYCAIVGGLGTILTWRILIHILRGAMPAFRLVAFLLAAPLAVLGIYCIFPHPFYDPDCTFVVLCGILLLFQLERAGFPPRARISYGNRSRHSAFREAEYRARISGGSGDGHRRSDRARSMAQENRCRSRMASRRNGRGAGCSDASASLHSGLRELLALDDSVRRVAPIAARLGNVCALSESIAAVVARGICGGRAVVAAKRGRQPNVFVAGCFIHCRAVRVDGRVLARGG